MGTGTVGGVHAVDVTVEQSRALVNVFRQRRVRRRQLGGDGELAGAQYALETAARDVAFLLRQWAARVLLERHNHCASSFSCAAYSWRTTRSHDELSFNR